VESVKAQTRRALETILVADRNPALLERARSLPGVKAVENVGTPGLGGARNSGVEAASGSIVAFLDDDAVASRQWLEKLARAYEDPNVLGVGGSIEPVWEIAKPRWFPDEFAWVVGCTYRGMPESEASVRNLIGCNMSYRREVVDELGGFRLGYGCDETDFCIRVRRRWPEGDLRYVPAAKVFHRVPSQRALWRHFRTRCYFEGGSKAVVSWLVGSDDGLSSERSYTLRTLPTGIVRGLADAVRGDVAGLARAGAITAGLGITVTGYIAGKLSVVDAARRRGWAEDVGGASDVPLTAIRERCA
jgi:glycosyltransferase involved in cell wall biosynthesis